MAGPATLFREIHRLRRFLAELQEQLDRIPRQRKVFQGKLAKHEQALKEEQEAIKKLKVLAAEREKTMKATHEQIGRHEKKFESVVNKKEYDALQIEIAAGRERYAKYEEEIFAAIGETEERAARLPGMEKAVEAARQELTRFEAEVTPRKTLLEAEQKQAKGHLAEAEKQIPDDLRSQYDRTVLSLGADGFAEVRNRTCTHCNTEILRHTESDLKRDLFVMCMSCGRILYLPADAVVADESDNEGAGED